jgi:predicted DNA-binding transcriptional regulator AlpA
MTVSILPNVEDRLLSANDVKKIAGKGHTWLYAAMKDGRIPAPRKIGKRNAWLASEINAWMSALPKGR